MVLESFKNDKSKY